MSSVAQSLPAAPGDALRRRRRAVPAVVAALLLAVAMGGVWWWFFALGERQSVRVLFSAGAATVRSAELAGATPLATAAVLPGAGARLATGDDGFITVRLDDGTVLKLMPGTTLDIEDARASRSGGRFSSGLRLLSGEIEARVPEGDGAGRDMRLFSDSIAIGVRGTEFTVAEGGAAARLMVTRGRVEARGSRGAAVAVDADRGTVVRAGEAPGPVSVLPPPPRPQASAAAADGIALRWDDPSAQPHYVVEVAEDDAFERLLRRSRMDGREGTLAPLERDGRYFWRVAGIDARGLRGRYSAPAVLEHTFYLEQGRAALGRLDAQAVRANLARSLDGLDPEIDALRERGRAALERGDAAAARDALTTVLGLRPGDGTARLALARAQFRLLDYAAARRGYEAVLASPDGALADRARVGIAHLDVREGRFDDALASTSPLLEANPRHVGALTVSAMAMVGLGDRAGAAAYLRRALDAAPGDATARALAATLEDAPAMPLLGPRAP